MVLSEVMVSIISEIANKRSLLLEYMAALCPMGKKVQHRGHRQGFYAPHVHIGHEAATICPFLLHIFFCISNQGVSMVAGGISIESKQVNKVDRGNKGISMVVRGISMVNR